MSAPKAPEFITVAPRASHTATVIFVHGLGDSGRGWLPLAQTVGADPALQHVKWVLPNAPRMNVTANRGAYMPSWYDIIEFGFGAEDEPGIIASAQSITELIVAEVNSGIPANHVVLGGFSQGATMSLFIGLTTRFNLAGIVVLSGRLTLRSKVKDMLSEHALSVPIFWGHGKDDVMVKFQLSVDAVKFLQNEIGIKAVDLSNPPDTLSGLSFHAYEDVAHFTCNEEMDDLKDWLVKVVPDAKSTLVNPERVTET